ncbi:hypothetical protein GP486_007273 [Trichoglossum hirsutum]|uniref:Bromodomain-containing protein n=1 Tax=Trichoglossum hirsutum TaxID=265104 RepID=A0A9P8IG42_9PEZI|nr:hypothetical protein GP486_007273 [Trichoglossum hirsutum]
MTSQPSLGAQEQKYQPVSLYDDMALDLDVHGTSKEGDINTENAAFDSSVSLAELTTAEESQVSLTGVNGLNDATALSNGTDVDTGLLSSGDTPPPEFKRQLSASAPLSRLTLSADTNQTPSAAEAAAMDPQGDAVAETSLEHKEAMDVDVSEQMAGEPPAGEKPATASASSAPEASVGDLTAAATETTERDGDGDGDRDHEMADVPESSGKNVRAREDDDDMEEPATKKTRTGDDGSPTPEFKMPVVPSAEAASQTNGRVSASSAVKTITKTQQKYLLVGLRNLKRIKDAAPFLEPVDPVKLNIPTYFSIIKNPMDISTMEKKLKAEEYATVEEYVADMDLIASNAVTFNGPDHFVSAHASNLKKAFEKQLGHLPKADVVEPSTAEKKAKKWAAGNAPAPKTTPVRRPSRTASGQASSPTGGGATSSFALGPNGVPTIRRDSTTGDGRPKREIHPPPSRDLPYSGAKPRKKKFLAELKFCDEVIKELFKTKYSSYAHVFYEPVDPVALNIPQYHKIIKKPMDLGTISSKLKANQYENATEFEADMRQIFANCFKFNPPKDAVHQFGKQLEQLFNEKWSEKKAYLERHAGVSGSRSPASSVEPEEEASEEEDGEEVERVIHEKIREITQHVEVLKKMKAKAKRGKGGAATSGGSLPSGKKASKKIGASTTAAPPAKNKKKLAKPKEPKAPYVTYEQKQEISDKINTLATNKMNQAYKIIRDNMPQLTGQGDDGELELDIDELPNDVLYKLLQFVQKHAPSSREVHPESPPKVSSAAKGGIPKTKKNKPMKEESSGDDDESGSESEEE